MSKSDKENVFNEVCGKIDNIKMMLFECVSKLDDVEMKRKAKTLDKIITL